MTSLNYVLARKLLKTKSKKQNGFTLIELMVVIAIVGTLSAVGLPELMKAQGAAKDSAALQEAVAAAKTCSMDILTGGGSYAAAIAADPAVWEYVTSNGTACVTDGSTDSTIVATGEVNKHTITIADGVPGKPVTEAK